MIILGLDDEAARAVRYALDAHIPESHYEGWKKASRALDSAMGDTEVRREVPKSVVRKFNRNTRKEK